MRSAWPCSGFTGYRLLTNQINWVGNWPLWSAVRWSDISVLELDRTALVLSRLFATSLAVFLVVLTLAFFRRREWDAIRVVHRLSPRPLFRASWRLIPWAVLPLFAGIWLALEVGWGHEGGAAKKQEKDYWRKNLATYLDAKVPDLTHVELDLDLFPERSRYHVTGTYDLINLGEQPLERDPADRRTALGEADLDHGRPEVRSQEQRRALCLHAAEGLARSRPDRANRVRARGDLSPRNQQERRRHDGVHPALVRGADELSAEHRARAGLRGGGRHRRRQSPRRQGVPRRFLQGTDRLVPGRPHALSRPRSRSPARPSSRSTRWGPRPRRRPREGRRTVVWESDHPVSFFNVVAGRWQVERGEGTAVYYHSGPSLQHRRDPRVRSTPPAAITRSGSIAYPWQELKLSEFPNLASYAQGFPTNITFSEGIGFLTNSSPEIHVAFEITAHEAAHQWWGNILTPGKGPGGNILAEGTAHFSTILLVEQVKGLNARIDFCKRLEANYGKDRQADSERPLVKITGEQPGDTTVTYDKGGWVFWMLLNQMGRDRALAGMQAFIKTYHGNPDHPVLQDFLAAMRPFAADAAAFDALHPPVVLRGRRARISTARAEEDRARSRLGSRPFKSRMSAPAPCPSRSPPRAASGSPRTARPHRRLPGGADNSHSRQGRVARRRDHLPVRARTDRRRPRRQGPPASAERRGDPIMTHLQPRRHESGHRCAGTDPSGIGSSTHSDQIDGAAVASGELAVPGTGTGGMASGPNS